MLNLQFSHRRALTSHSVVHGKADIVERTRTVHWVVVSLVIVYWAAGYHPTQQPRPPLVFLIYVERLLFYYFVYQETLWRCDGIRKCVFPHRKGPMA